MIWIWVSCKWWSSILPILTILADKDSHHIYKNVFEVSVQSPCLKVTVLPIKYKIIGYINNQLQVHIQLYVYTHEFKSLSYILFGTLNKITLPQNYKNMRSWNVQIWLFTISKPHANAKDVNILFALGVYITERTQICSVESLLWHIYDIHLSLAWIAVNLHISSIHFGSLVDECTIQSCKQIKILTFKNVKWLYAYAHIISEVFISRKRIARWVNDHFRMNL